MRRILASLGPIVCAIALASCGGGDDGPDLASLQVTPDPVTLAQQQTAQLQVSVLDTQGQLVTGVSVTFTSSDPQVASVTNTGLVTASHAGSTSIRVKASSLTHMVPVTVTAVSNAVVVTPNPGVVPQNGTLQLNAVVNDLNGLAIPGAPVTFTSGTPSLASVSASGLVDPVGPAGQVVITVASGALTTAVPVAITQVATALDVNPNPAVMGKSGTLQLTTTVRDLMGAPMAGIAATYQSSNTGLATVTTGGLVQGKGSVGALSIQVAAAGLTSNVPLSLVDVGSPQGVLDGTSTVSGVAYGVDVSAAGLIMVSGSVTSRATLANRVFTSITTPTGFQYAPAIAVSGSSAWVSGLPDFQISEVNATTGALLGTVTGATGANYFMLRFNATGTRLYASGSGRFVVINPSTRAAERDMSTQSQGLSLALNPVGTTVFVGGYGPIEEINPATGATRVVTSEGNTNFAISPDGQRLYLVSEADPAIKVIQVSNGALLKTIPVGCAGWGIAVTPDGQKLYDTCNGTIFIIDLATDAVQPIAVGGTLRRTAFSVDGLTAVITNADLGVHFIR